jgi:hypothetical protein
MRYTAEVRGGKLIAVFLESISDSSANNPFVCFYDIHERKREVLFFSFVPDTIRDLFFTIIKITLSTNNAVIVTENY